jgi:dihydroorotase
MDVVVEGNCYLKGRFERCCIGIRGGRIARIAKILEGDRVFRYSGMIVLPGAIDAHVHFRDPGMTDKEDFRTGSLSAVHGGVTCVLDMPNTKPPTTTPRALKEKKEAAMSKSWCDFGLFAGVVPGVDVRSLAADSVGFKLYMAGTTGDLLAPSLERVKDEIAAVAASGKVLAVHAEDERLRKKGPESGLEDHLKNRPNECETSAIRKVKEAAKACRLHICHVSARESLTVLSGSQSLTSEVTPHHLLLDKDSRLGTFGKVNPPLRRREDRQALFKALTDGKIELLVSDHAPHTLDEKQEDFDFAPSGLPGVETLVPVLLHLTAEKNLTYGDLVRRVCAGPSKVYGLNKGMLAEGRDADLLVVDPRSSTTVRADDLHSKCGWSAFEGMKAIFPKAVFLRGEEIVRDGSLVGERMGRDVVEQADRH